MIPSPKAKFLSDSGAANRHLDMVASAHFQAACDVAMLEMIAAAPSAVDDATAASNYNRLIGGREILKKLCTLADVHEVPKKETDIYQQRHQKT
jgi:hypothetical protein